MMHEIQQATDFTVTSDIEQWHPSVAKSSNAWHQGYNFPVPLNLRSDHRMG